MDAPETNPAPHRPAASDLSGDITGGSPYWDHSIRAILFANLITLAGAVTQHWSAAPIMWIYWGQSVVIGIANVIRMLSLKEFSTDGFRSGGRQVAANQAGKISTATFFVVHFGMFHLGYAVFLASGRFGTVPPGVGQLTVLANILLFAGGHFVPLVRMHGNDLLPKRPNLGTLMFYPYLRIIPMHLGTIFGAMMPIGALPLFILLKTGADLGMHEVERRMFRSTD